MFTKKLIFTTKRMLFGCLSLALVSMFFGSCEHTEVAEEKGLSNIEMPEKIIETVTAVNLYQNDEATRLSILGKENTSFEEKGIYFDLYNLKNYISNIEEKALEFNKDISAMYFVFGADNTGNRTIFLMPGYSDTETELNEAFTLENDELVTFDVIANQLAEKELSNNSNNFILTANGYASYNEAVELFNKYENDFIAPFASKVTKEFYIKTCWYSLSVFKEYISYVEEMSTDNKLGITGINFYYGVHNNDNSLGYKSNSQTLFLVPSDGTNTIINRDKDSFEPIQSFPTERSFNSSELIQDELNAIPPRL